MSKSEAANRISSIIDDYEAGLLTEKDMISNLADLVLDLRDK